MLRTIDEYFARKTPLNFPLPKVRRPYVKTIQKNWGGYEITGSIKASKSGRIQLLKEKEVIDCLYIQGTDWQEIKNEVFVLENILKTGGLDNTTSLVV